MSDTHKLYYVNNYNHWKILVLFLDLSYFLFLTQTLTRQTYLYNKP